MMERLLRRWCGTIATVCLVTLASCGRRITSSWGPPLDVRLQVADTCQELFPEQTKLAHLPWYPLAEGQRIRPGSIILLKPGGLVVLRWDDQLLTRRFHAVLTEFEPINTASCTWEKQGKTVIQRLKDRQVYVLQPDLRVLSAYAVLDDGSGPVVEEVSSAWELRVFEPGSPIHSQGLAFFRSVEFPGCGKRRTDPVEQWQCLKKAGIAFPHEVPLRLLCAPGGRCPNPLGPNLFAGEVCVRVAPKSPRSKTRQNTCPAAASGGAYDDLPDYWIIVNSKLLESLPEGWHIAGEGSLTAHWGIYYTKGTGYFSD